MSCNIFVFYWANILGLMKNILVSGKGISSRDVSSLAMTEEAELGSW